jgi:hypothetical protein
VAELLIAGTGPPGPCVIVGNGEEVTMPTLLMSDPPVPPAPGPVPPGPDPDVPTPVEEPPYPVPVPPEPGDPPMRVTPGPL